MILSIKKAPARWIGGKKTHESDSYVWKIWWFWPKNRQKSGFLPLHFNWQEMAMVFDPNFGKNMNNWYITNKRNVASLRQTPNFWLRGFFDPKIGKKSGFFPLHFNWQLMAMVFDPNFGKNMNNWYITKERNVASLRQTPKFWLRGIFDPKISKKVDFFN